MLKFVKHHMETISGIEIYPILSLLLFFSFFVVLALWVFTYQKDKIKELSNIPLQDGIEEEVVEFKIFKK